MLPNKWDNVLKDEYKKEYFINLEKFIEDEYKNKIIYPPKEQIYSAFEYTSFDKVKVVILGQDPYYKENQANGLAFSVKNGVKVPPSLKNIYKELYSDLGITNKGGDLSAWAKQGVLLLNTSLTVVKDKPNSHKNIGWEIFTYEVLKQLNKKEDSIVFIFWGNNAILKERFITNKKHLVLKAPHPSPLSAYKGFFGCSHFSKTNDFLRKNNIDIIDWCIED